MTTTDREIFCKCCRKVETHMDLELPGKVRFKCKTCGEYNTEKGEEVRDYRVVFLRDEYIIALSGPETGRKFRNKEKERLRGRDYKVIEQYVVIEGGCFPYEAFDTKEEADECVKSLEENAVLLEGRSVCPTCGQNTK